MALASLVSYLLASLATASIADRLPRRRRPLPDLLLRGVRRPERQPLCLVKRDVTRVWGHEQHPVCALAVLLHLPTAAERALQVGPRCERVLQVV